MDRLEDYIKHSICQIPLGQCEYDYYCGMCRERLVKEHDDKVRADAIDEFAELLEKHFYGMMMSSGMPREGVTWESAYNFVKKTAEQLKESEDGKTNCE